MTPKKQRDKTLNRTSRIEIRLNEVELKTIKKKAQNQGLNASTFLRNLSINYPVKSMVERKAITSLLKVNGDLGEAGGLFKMWIMSDGEYKDDFTAERTYENIDELVDEIERLMQDLRNSVSELMTGV